MCICIFWLSNYAIFEIHVQHTQTEHNFCCCSQVIIIGSTISCVSYIDYALQCIYTHIYILYLYSCIVAHTHTQTDTGTHRLCCSTFFSWFFVIGSCCVRSTTFVAKFYTRQTIFGRLCALRDLTQKFSGPQPDNKKEREREQERENNVRAERN